jgi:hypothetical protein
MDADSQVVELTISTTVGAYIVPLSPSDARTMLRGYGLLTRHGALVDMEKEPLSAVGTLLAAMWLHKIAGMEATDPINVELGDGSSVAIRPTSIMTIAARSAARKRGIGFGAIRTGSDTTPKQQDSTAT